MYVNKGYQFLFSIFPKSVSTKKSIPSTFDNFKETYSIYTIYTRKLNRETFQFANISNNSIYSLKQKMTDFGDYLIDFFPFVTSRWIRKIYFEECFRFSIKSEFPTAKIVKLL